MACRRLAGRAAQPWTLRLAPGCLPNGTCGRIVNAGLCLRTALLRVTRHARMETPHRSNRQSYKCCNEGAQPVSLGGLPRPRSLARGYLSYELTALCQETNAATLRIPHAPFLPQLQQILGRLEGLADPRPADSPCRQCGPGTCVCGAPPHYLHCIPAPRLLARGLTRFSSSITPRCTGRTPEGRRRTAVEQACRRLPQDQKTSPPAPLPAGRGEIAA
jgi:hypothetical protein